MTILQWEPRCPTRADERTARHCKANSRFFEVRRPRCMSKKSNYKLHACIVRHNCVLGGMLFPICKAQLHVSAINFGHLQVVQ